MTLVDSLCLDDVRPCDNVTDNTRFIAAFMKFQYGADKEKNVQHGCAGRQGK